MDSNSVKVRPWPGTTKPSAAEIRRRFSDESLQPYQWSNGPGDTYGAHRHSYNKVIYVVSGSITFSMPDMGEHAFLTQGDRLDLPAGVMHSAIVGPDGVVCLEAHR